MVKRYTKINKNEKIIIKAIIALLTIILVIPIILNYLFLYGLFGWRPINTNIMQNDWLLFWAGYLSFVGTIFLGIVSYLQNINLNKQNKAQLDFQKSNIKRPFFIIESVKLSSNGEQGISLEKNSQNWGIRTSVKIFADLQIVIKNIGDGVAINTVCELFYKNDVPQSECAISSDLIFTVKENDTYVCDLRIFPSHDTYFTILIRYSNIMNTFYCQESICNKQKVKDNGDSCYDMVIGIGDLGQQEIE